MRGEGTGPTTFSKPAPNPRMEGGLPQSQVALYSLGCASYTWALRVLVFRWEKGLKTTSFHSFRAATLQKLVKEIKKQKENGRISNDSLLFALDILKDLLCVCMSHCN